MVTRRRVVLALGAGALYAASTRAQTLDRAGKSVRVGILAPSSASKEQSEKPFVDAMRELGWVEGRNIAYDRVYADDDQARLPAHAAALVRRAPNVIYAFGNQAALTAFAATRTIPIIFAAISGPVEIGLVESLARPGGNVTGTANIGWELGGKRLQLLKQALPKIVRVGVMVQPTHSDSTQELKLIEEAARILHVTVVPVMAKEAKDIDGAFVSLAKGNAEALLTTHTYFFITDERKHILALAAKQRLPVIGPRSNFAEDGALLSYGSIQVEQFSRAARLVDKILKGARPADIPVELPTRFELVVNKKTAKVLGLKIPNSILVIADKMIE